MRFTFRNGICAPGALGASPISKLITESKMVFAFRKAFSMQFGPVTYPTGVEHRHFDVSTHPRERTGLDDGDMGSLPSGWAQGEMPVAQRPGAHAVRIRLLRCSNPLAPFEICSFCISEQVEGLGKGR